MAETKDFTCRACGAQFDTRDTLDQHNRREHGTQGRAGAGGQQSYGDSGTQRGGTTEPRDKRTDEASDWEDER